MTRTPSVAWDGILPDAYLTTTFAQLNSPVLFDKFQKRICQAFAATSSGPAYVFYPNGLGDPVDLCSTLGQGLNPPGGYSAWCGQCYNKEFPALTRNPNVVAIYQIDPDSGTRVGNLIWTQADGPKLEIQDSQVN
ncbi:hypothetical protein ONZ43_g6494 [Nemania bipapillata]|uniref:Uncharacterized protein n=1 Tax=Nemania bipapillata TaxID=110536 RepID=A0ACC2HZS9_9PEZI|nr:hypothetical protein ONZ43_g6494 [Nemania bipapillata]